MSDLRVLFPQSGATVPQDWVHRVDIVFVHGLNPFSKADHAENTWTHESGFMWPRNALPVRLLDARIMLFSYNSHMAWDVSEAGIREHANTLLDLTQSRRDETSSDVPLIFVGHSLGGLVIKQALLHATHNHRVYGTIRASTKALVFFGVPHRGGNGAVIGQIFAKSVSLFSGTRGNDLVRSLKKSSKYLAQISADFAHQLEDYQFLSVIETRGRFRGPIRTVVVDSSSAVLNLAGHREQVLELDRDHRQICQLEQGPDLNRVLRHMKQITITALTSRSAIIQQPAVTVLDTESGNEPLAQPRADVQVANTLDFRVRTNFYGREEQLSGIQKFLDHPSAETLHVYGPAGVGKSALAFEAVQRNKDRYSIFWFDAQRPETLQRGLESALHTVLPELRNVYLPNTLRDLVKWLRNEKARHWILVFDNVSRKYDALSVLRDTFKDGKIVAISRDVSAVTSSSAVLPVPELSESDGELLFLSIWEAKSHRQRQDIRNISSLKGTVKQLSRRALGIDLAARCASDMPTGSISDSMNDLEFEEVPPAGHLDRVIWKWFYLVTESLSPKTIGVLRLLSLFEYTHLSTAFLDLLKGSRATSAGLEPHVADIRTAISSSVIELTRRNLLLQCRDTSSSYLCIEPSIKDCIQHYQRYDSDHTDDILQDGMDLFAAGWRKTAEKSQSEQRLILQAVAPHVRAFSLNLTRRSHKLSSPYTDVCSSLTLYFLGKCVQEGSHRCIKQFWITWIKSEGLLVSETDAVDDDESRLISSSDMPTWLNGDPNSTQEHPKIIELVGRGLRESFKKSFTDGMMVAVIGQAWHGVRDNIFTYMRQLGRGRYTDTELQDMCDKVDKGAASGLASALRAVLVHDDTFIAEVTDSLGRDIREEITFLVTSSAPVSTFDVIVDDIDSVVEEALDFVLFTTFHSVTRSFSDLFHGIVASQICTLIDTTMTSETGTDSYEQVVAFMVDSFARSLLLERLKRVAHGFWQVIDGSKTWLAAKVIQMILCTKRVFMNDEDMENMTASLIHLIRHGIVALESRHARGWRLSAQRMMYWTLQAEQARIGWGALDHLGRSGFNFDDQERWEESMIHMDMSSGCWPVG